MISVAVECLCDFLHELYKYAFSCFIGLILIVLLKLFYLPPVRYGYVLIALIIGGITVAIFSTEIKIITKLIKKFKNSSTYLEISNVFIVIKNIGIIKNFGIIIKYLAIITHIPYPF